MCRGLLARTSLLSDIMDFPSLDLTFTPSFEEGHGKYFPHQQCSFRDAVDKQETRKFSIRLKQQPSTHCVNGGQTYRYNVSPD